jgi:processive 1,2-diacylglycerol beta-glucosyltransferase/1,2-diacylglycerol 3-beta-galactosyltransferase
VIDDKFSNKLSNDEIISVKKKFEYDPAKKILLILGGGDGIPKGEKILEELLKSKPDYEIGIVCGKNEILQKGAENRSKFIKQTSDDLRLSRFYI